MRATLPDPRGPWDRQISLAIDKAVVACESLMGHPVGRRVDRCAVFSHLFALALSEARGQDGGRA
jgi:hypothetical protein